MSRRKKSFITLRVDKKWYYANYQDVLSEGLDADKHYLRYGHSEGRIPNPFVSTNSNALKLLYLFLDLCRFDICNLKNDEKHSYQLINRFFIWLHFKIEYKFFKKLFKSKTKLYITSWVGGGVQDALKYYIDRDLKQDNTIIILKSIKHFPNKPIPFLEVKIVSNNRSLDSNFICPFPNYFLNFLIKNQMYLDEIAIHHVFGFENMIKTILVKIKIKSTYYFHDYYLFTSNWSFFKIKISEIPTHNMYFDSLTNLTWDKDARISMLDNISVITATSFHSYQLLLKEKNFPINKLRFEYIPEECDLEFTRVKKKPTKESRTLKVLILGNLGIYKGLEVLNEMVSLVKAEHNNITFFHIGGISEGALNSHVISYGWLEKYERSNLIENLNADLGLLPAQSPETYSLVLSELIRLGLPILASNIGAIPERIFDREFNYLVKDYTNSQAWASTLLSINRNGFLQKNNHSLYSTVDQMKIYLARKRN